MKKLKVGSLFLLSLLWLGPTLGFAEPPEEGDRPSIEEKMKRMSSELKLTPEQEKKLKEHKQAHREASKTLWEAVRAKKDELEKELSNPKFEENKVKALHSEITALKAKLADHRLQGILEVRRILSPEQFTKFQDMMKKRMGKGDRRERGGLMRERMKERRSHE